VRTTRIINTNAQFGFAAAFAEQNAAAVGALEHMTWSNICFIDDAAVGPINAVNAANQFTYPGLAAFGEAATLVPAAITMQVMCPTALQTATGIVYIGRSHAQYDLAGSTRTWDQLGNEFVSYMAPRLCSAAKLALRGVKVSSYPLDMSALADFRAAEVQADGIFTWANTTRLGPEGFAPLVIYNPNGVDLQLLITCEWRLRFDAGNPAAATHKTYMPTSDRAWAAMSSAAHSLGHGVEDIAEDVATVGAEAALTTAAVAAM
jgi:hypothetical protein